MHFSHAHVLYPEQVVSLSHWEHQCFGAHCEKSLKLVQVFPYLRLCTLVLLYDKMDCFSSSVFAISSLKKNKKQKQKKEI